MLKKLRILLGTLILVLCCSTCTVNASVRKKPVLNFKKLTLVPGDCVRLKLLNTNSFVKWSIIDYDVSAGTGLSYDEKGHGCRVLATRFGHNYIAAQYRGKVYYCKVNIVDLRLPKKIKLAGTGSIYQIRWKNIGRRLRFESTDKQVATVSKKGRVTAKNPGKCQINVYVETIPKYSVSQEMHYTINVSVKGSIDPDK